MAEKKEIDLAIKDSLGIFFNGDDPVKYTQPIATMEDMVGRGLLNEDGTATNKGVLFTTLQDAGAIDATGSLTPKGRAYSRPYDDSPQGVLNQGNIEAYKMRFADGVDKPSVTFGQALGSVGDMAWDIGAGLGKMLYYGRSSPFSAKKADPRSVILATSLTDNIIKANKELGKMIELGFSWVAANPLIELSDDFDNMMDEGLWIARQNQDRVEKAHQDMKTGEMAESVFGGEGTAAAVVAAKSMIPKAEGDILDKQAGAVGQLLTADAAIPGFSAFKAATTIAAKATRLTLRAQQVLGRVALEDVKIAAMQTAKVAAETVLRKEASSVALATKLAEDIALRGASDPALLARAERASSVASRIAGDASTARNALPSITADLEAAMTKRSSLSTRIPEASAQAFMKTLELGRMVKSLPVVAIGATLEGIGRGLSATDNAVMGFLKERGISQLYTGAAGAAGVVGLAGNPLLGGVGAAAAILKTGKLAETAGKMFRYVGKEMAQVRGQIPFWQRVAAHTAPGTANRALAHTFGMFELGGATSDILRRTARGVVAAAPVDLAFEFLSDGADFRKETAYQALSESLVLGGSFAAAGGAFMGTKARMRALSLGDEINFRQQLVDADQKAYFVSIPSESRRAIATYSIANPTLNFNFTNKGSSNYDINTNTATINVASTNPLKALISHEVLHHTIIKNNMEAGISALFLGDTTGNTTGGLLRDKNGALDPNFAEFVETYNRRMDNAGVARPSLNSMAVEYFIEQHADQYSSMAESGELGAMASRGAARRGLSSILETILPRSAVLKDLHHKSGGMIDASGASVMGSGLLADGIRQLPASKRMFRDMTRRSAGLAPGQFSPLGSEVGDNGGAGITLNPTNSIDIDLMHPLIQHNADGNPIIRDGKPVAIDKATELLRSAAGVTVMETLRKNRLAGKRYAPGEMHLDDNGDLQGNWLPPDVIRDVIENHKFNREQAQVIRNINAAIKTGDGNRMIVINFPATKKLRNGKTVYSPQAATIRDIVPVALTITKDNNLLVGLMSVTKLHENILKRSSSKRGRKLYGGNTDTILTDARAMMDYHKTGVDSIDYFKQKYGAVEADERKKFINTVFGLLNKSEQALLNPMLLEDGVGSRDNVYRTYRIDRVSKAVPMDASQYPAMPFNYEATSQVKMPEQIRQMPEASSNEKKVAIQQNKNQDEAVNERQPTTIQAQSSRTSTSGSEATGEGLQEQGRLSGGSELVQPSNRPSDSSIPLEGLPATVNVPGLGEITFGPNEVARKVAMDYANEIGIDYNPPKQYAKVDKKRAMRVADEYDKMVHAPNDPNVKASYDAMIKETIAQWEAIKKTGLKVEPIPAGATDPYKASPRLAILDVKDNNHLWFFPTSNGFGTSETANIDVSGNPLMNPTGEFINGHEMLANDVFRIVHDYFGHIKEGVGFRADGEENAWRSHSAMYSDLARPAMTSETRGQNSWVNYGPYAEFNKTASAEDTVYAPQKTGIMPDWVMSEGSSDSTPETESKGVRYMPETDTDVKIIEKSDTDTEQGAPAPDSDVQSIPLTGNPIPWDRTASRQVRFMPEAIRDAFPTMSPKLLAEIEKETSTLAAIHIDRMRVGEYMGIDLQGGMFYPTIKENLENGVVWAFNSTNVARTVANRAAQNKGYVKLVLMQEGNVVGNKTFTNIWFKILSDSIDKKKISKSLALTELNAARRVVYNKIKSKDIKRNPWVLKHSSNWGSLDEAKESILSMPQIERGASYFKKSKTQTKAEGEKMAYQALLSQKMTKIGFPDAKKIVTDIEEPAFKGIPTGAAVAIIKFDPLAADAKVMTAKEAGVPEHISYGWVLKGKPVAKIGYYQVIDEAFPTTKGQIMTQQSTNFPVRASIPSKKLARGEIKYDKATQLSIANAVKLK